MNNDDKAKYIIELEKENRLLRESAADLFLDFYQEFQREQFNKSDVVYRYLRKLRSGHGFTRPKTDTETD